MLTAIGKQIQSTLGERSIRLVNLINATSFLTVASSEPRD